MSYGRWRTTTKRLRDLSTSDYMVDGKHVRRFNWNEPQRRVEARGRVVLLGVFHGNSSYVLVALQNPGEPAIEEFKVNQPPDEKDAFSAGDKILVTLVADQELTIPSDVNPTLDLAFDNPTYPRVATFNHSSSSGKEMVFEYTVQDADTDADGYEIVAGSLRGATGIVSSDDEQLNPRFNCGRNVVAIDGDRLPKIDGVRVSGGGISLKFCPAEVDEGVSFTCYLENTSDESRVVSWAVYADPDHSPPVHEWDNLRVRAADDAGPGGVIIEEPNGWSQAMDSEDDGVVEFRWTLGGLGPGQTAIASFTPQDDQVIEEPKVFKIAWAHASYGSGFAGLGHYVTVLDNEPPARPTGLHAVPSDRQAILNWDDPDDDAITGYEYRYKVGDGDFGPWTDMEGSGATTTHLVTNLTNDVEHTFVIRASSRFGESLESEPATVTPKQFSGDWSYVTVVEPAVLIAEGPDTVSVSVIATYQVRADLVAEVVSMEAVTSPEGAEAIFSVPADANGLGFGGLDGTLVSSGTVTIANNPECEHQPIGTLTCELASIDGLYARPPILSGDYTVSVSVPDEFALTASVNIDETLPHVPTSAGIPDATLEVLGRPTQPTGFTATAGPEQVLLNWDDPGDASTMMYQYTSGVGEFKLTASDGARRDEFGRSVAMDGDTIVVGAYSDDDNGADSGSAYVFTRPATGWATATETVKLTASDGLAYDHFGGSAGVDGDTIVVGAPRDDTGRFATGSAYVFTKPAADWASATETAKLTASDGAADDHFGGSAGVDGDTIVVGAPRDDDDGSLSGSVYASTMPAAGWATATETAKLTASDGAADDYFGWSVGVDGDNFVVGARRDDAKGSNSGSVYVYVSVSWTDIPNSAPGEVNSTSYMVEGLTNGVEYPFQIRAVNAFGNGPATDIVYATPRDVPGQPRSLQATHGDSRVTLGWDAPLSDGGFPITKHWYSLNGGEWTEIDDSGVGGANAASHEVEDLINGTEYTFTVRAENSTGAGPASDRASATPGTTPGPPVDLGTELAGSGRTMLIWKEPASGGGRPILKFQYRQSPDAGASWVADWTDIESDGPGTGEYLVSGLNNGDEYTWEVRAVNQLGSGSAASVAGTLLSVPGQPQGLSYSPLHLGVSLSWLPPQDDGGTAILRYEFQQGSGDWVEVPVDALPSSGRVSRSSHGASGSNSRDVQVSGLASGISYLFTVRAVNRIGAGRVAKATGTPMGSPGAPIDLAAAPSAVRSR